MTIRTTTRNATAIARALQNGENFTTSGALKGVANPPWIAHGRIKSDDGAAMYRACDEIGIDYVVYSYGTPIAYRTKDKGEGDGEWTIPDAKYSVTTSKHQGTIADAISIAQK